MNLPWRIIALISVTLIWGTTFVIVKETLETIPASLLLTLRFGVALLALLWVRPKRESLAVGIILGILNWAGFATQTIGLEDTTPSKAAFITGFAVILTPLLSSLYFRKRLAWQVYSAAAIAIIGLGLLTLSGANGNITNSAGITLGDMWVLVCAFCYAVMIIYVGEIKGNHNVLHLTAVQLYPMAFLSFLWAIPELHRLPDITWQSYAAVIYLALIATIATSLLHLWGQQRVSTSLTAVIFVFEPVFAAIFAAIFIDERLGLWGYSGAGLIFIAMLLSEWKSVDNDQAVQK